MWMALLIFVALIDSAVSVNTLKSMHSHHRGGPGQNKQQPGMVQRAVRAILPNGAGDYLFGAALDGCPMTNVIQYQAHANLDGGGLKWWTLAGDDIAGVRDINSPMSYCVDNPMAGHHRVGMVAKEGTKLRMEMWSKDNPAAPCKAKKDMVLAVTKLDESDALGCTPDKKTKGAVKVGDLAANVVLPKMVALKDYAIGSRDCHNTAADIMAALGGM